jgi:hypothetical protein
MFAPTILAIMFGNLAAAAALPWLAWTVLAEDHRMAPPTRSALGCTRTPQADVGAAGAARSRTRRGGETARQPLKYPGLPPSRKAA